MCLFFKFIKVAASSRRSSWVPTSTIGVFGAKCSISSNHWNGHTVSIYEAFRIVRSATYLVLDVFERAGLDYRKTDEENIGSREYLFPCSGFQYVVLFGKRSIPKGKADWFTIISLSPFCIVVKSG